MSTTADRVAAVSLRRPARVTPLVLLGPGAIGREFLAQLAINGRQSARIRVCGIVDSSGYALAAKGVLREQIADVRAHKDAGHAIARHPLGQPAAPLNALAYMVSQVRGRPILVDATAADTHDMLAMALERGWSAVLANKVPMTGEQDRIDALRRVARRGGGRIKYEATVGAGLPVLDTLRKLREAGDRVASIEGCPSGTLGFLLSELDRGRPFDRVLAEARVAGLTEPDPRADLSGLDVARKALILARAIGYRGGLASFETENLIPPGLRDVPLREFLSRAAEMNENWALRVRDAHSRDAVLRYRAWVTPERVRVGLAEVPRTDPVSLLRGTDNQFSFTTSRYSRQPLVIAGPGAGPDVTAAGVYNDVLTCARLRV